MRLSEGFGPARRRTFRSASVLTATGLTIGLLWVAPGLAVGSPSLLTDAVDTIAGPALCERPVPAWRPMAGSAALATVGGRLLATARYPGKGVVLTDSGREVDSRLLARGRDRLGSTPAAFAATEQNGAVLAGPTSVASLTDQGGELAVGRVDDRARLEDLGDTGPVARARFKKIRLIAAAGDENLIVADEVGPDEVRLRLLNLSDQPVPLYGGTAQSRVVPPGTVDTVARAGDGGRLSTATAEVPAIGGLPTAMAASGDTLYLATSARGAGRSIAEVHMLNLGDRAVTAQGITTFPGKVATLGGAGQGRIPSLGRISAIATGLHGDVYLADPSGSRVWRVDSAGVVTSFAGTGRRGWDVHLGRDVRSARLALNRPVDVDVDGYSGQVHIFDEGLGVVRSVDGAGLVHSGCNAPFGAPPGTRARPSSVAIIGDSVYTSGGDLGGVQQVTPDGSLIMTAELSSLRTCRSAFCARPSPGSPTDWGPVSIAGHKDILYMLDGGSGLVRAANLGHRARVVLGTPVAAGKIQTVAGGGRRSRPGGQVGDEGPARSATLAAPGSSWSGQGLAVAPRGDLFVVDGGRVRMVDDRGTISTAIQPGQAGMGEPTSLAVDSEGNVLVGDGERVRLLNRTGRPIDRYGIHIPTAALVPLPGSDVSPAGLAVDRRANLYVASTTNHTVHRISPDGHRVRVIGVEGAGFNGDGRPGVVTALSSPTGLVVDRSDHLVIADRDNERIRVYRIGSTERAPNASGPTFGWQARLLASATVLVAVGALARRATRSKRTGRRRWVVSALASTAVLAAVLLPVGSGPPSDSASPHPNPLLIGRALHTATLLDPPACKLRPAPRHYPCGEVLVLGGEGGKSLGGDTRHTERYDPAIGTWRLLRTAPLKRFAHTSTLLPDGRVLVVGGETGQGVRDDDPRGLIGTDDSSLYDPATDTWRPTVSPLAQGRFFHTATLLDGPQCHQPDRPSWCGRVLVAGGSDRQRSRPSLPSVELYDPAAHTWSSVAPMTTARQNHIAALLPDGRVLVAGGIGPSSGSPGTEGDRQALTSAEIYDPGLGTWSPTGPMAVPRAYHSATVLESPDCLGLRLPDWCEKVIVTGGFTVGGTEESYQAGQATAAVELFDPALLDNGTQGAWRPLRSMGSARQGHALALAWGGQIVVAGGHVTTSETYGAWEDRWLADRPLALGLMNLTATRLEGPLCRNDRPPRWCGRALLVGGITPPTNASIQGHAEDTVELRPS